MSAYEERSICIPVNVLLQEVVSGQPDIDPVGRPKPAKSAFQKATGEARYVDDTPMAQSKISQLML